ncbi:MAG TPA: CBS domain-containing protein [Pyrinomonadaceae bacterium]|jgi:CBS domain-containing protein|nr:CBS domain-containing protein [Pyrinomonadaceae bacterium]
MLYLSQVLGRPVRDREGERRATIKDVIVRLGEDHPPVTGLVARSGRRDFFVARPTIAQLNYAGARLNSDKFDLTPFTRYEGEVLLARDVLDKQLIDVDGKRVVRVNDVQLIEAGGELRVTGADVSLQGLWRRLAPAGLSGKQRPVEVIDWADVGYLATDAATVRLKSSADKLARLHPVEIARLAEALSYHQTAEVVEALDDETAAETLEEMPEEQQARIIGDMDEERAADILEWMSPDEAADVLGDLPEAKAEELLGLMEGAEQADVAELLPYEDNTAGGLMTTEFVTLPKNLTVAGALARLREMAETPNMIYYLYVVETEGSWKLCGVIALRSLILADPTFRLDDVMRDDFQHAHTGDAAREVAELIAEYNLLALPVLDDAGDIAGIVTVDDAMELLLPKGWRQRLPRVFG